MFKKSFTLAEIMIALTVIGIITAILLPVAYNSSPSEKVMKFKKANVTLAKLVNELATSGEYFVPGDLGKKADGSWADEETYFCSCVSDILSIKKETCLATISSAQQGRAYTAKHWEYMLNTSLFLKGLTQEEYIDKICKDNEEDLNQYIQMTDGIYFWESNPTKPFGYSYYEDTEFFNDTSCINSPIHNFLYCKFTPEGYNSDDVDSGMFTDLKNYVGFYIHYKNFCIDIDDIDKGEDPFGYGIRIDGKIILGKRAQEWLEKDIQDKE